MTNFFDVRDEVTDKRVLLFLRITAIHFSGLTEVVRLLNLLTTRHACDRLRRFNIVRIRLRRVFIAVRLVVDRARLLLEWHRPVTLVVRDLSERAVDRKLKVVRSDAVTLRIRIREETSLEHLVFRWLNSWYENARVEADRLCLGEVVVDVLVEGHRSDQLVWDDILEPIFRRIERIEVEVIHISRI